MRLGATPRLLLAIGFLAGCYAPSELTGAPCDLAHPNCPSDQVCMMGRDGATCQIDHTTRPDAPQGGEAGDTCFGSGLVKNVCLTSAPTGSLSLSIAINTATVGSPNCTSLEPQSGGPPLCVIAADSITIDTGRTVSAIGVNPLVLVANTTIAINGTLDVASHGSGGAIGAGAQTTCGAATINGTNGSGGNGGGGGAGGSFGTTGANGGKGHNHIGAGVAGAATTPAVLVGGCPGGAGGAGDGGGGAGTGGGGGGAVYLIANGSITIGGTLDASGSGGGGGSGGLNSGGGAGGGGAGGFIGLDSPTITVSGSVFANGGGGGGGNGDQPDKGGTAGGDPIAPATQATAGQGGGGGGANGGKGFATAGAPGAGSNVGNCSTSPGCGGGGGGGGAGIIRQYRGTVSGGTVSPPPS